MTMCPFKPGQVQGTALLKPPVLPLSSHLTMKLLLRIKTMRRMTECMPLGLQAAFRNQGGFHMIGSGRGKIEKQEDLQKAADVAQELQLDGLIVCGGDDSNTNAAVLAEFFKAKGETNLTHTAQ